MMKTVIVLLAISSVALAAGKTSAPVSPIARLSSEDQRLYFSQRYFPGCLEQTEGADVAARARAIARRIDPQVGPGAVSRTKPAKGVR